MRTLLTFVTTAILWALVPGCGGPENVVKPEHPTPPPSADAIQVPTPPSAPTPPRAAK